MKMNKIKGSVNAFSARWIFIVLIVFLSVAPVFSANVIVPEFEIYTWGRDQGSGFQLDSYGDLELLLDGGYKFGANLMFDFTSSALETAADNDMLSFKSASITLRNLFNKPLNFTYFIGQGDTLCSGELFQRHFGASPIGSLYTSFVHFPTASGVDFYRGIHTVYGTGGKIEFAPDEENWLLSVYIYQDAAPTFISTGPPPTLDYGHASLDVRAAFDWEAFKLEAFLGATYPVSDSSLGYYRSGLLMYTGINKVEFLAEIGIPLWKPTVDAFSFDLVYALVEQRARMKILSETFTVMWRPSYYHQDAVLVADRGLDINLDLRFGNEEKSALAGGIEGNFVYPEDPAGDPTAKVIPYLQFATSGVVYELRASTKVYPFDTSELLEVFMSVKASF